MGKRVTGYYSKKKSSEETVNAFIPKPLPPTPTFFISPELKFFRSFTKPC